MTGSLKLKLIIIIKTYRRPENIRSFFIDEFSLCLEPKKIKNFLTTYVSIFNSKLLLFLSWLNTLLFLPLRY